MSGLIGLCIEYFICQCVCQCCGLCCNDIGRKLCPDVDINKPRNQNMDLTGMSNDDVELVEDNSPCIEQYKSYSKVPTES